MLLTTALLKCPPVLANTVLGGAASLGKKSERVKSLKEKKKVTHLLLNERGEKSGICPELQRRVLVRLSVGSTCIMSEYRQQLRM